MHHEVRCTPMPPQLRGNEERDGTRSPSVRTLRAVRGDARYLYPSTMENYRLSVNFFKDVCGDRVIDQYSASDVERFKNAQIERKVSKVSVNIWLHGVKSVFGFALKHEWIMKSPFQRSLEFAIRQQTPTYVAKQDFQTLLGKVKEPVLRDLFLFAALSGLRLSERLNLNWSAVDFEKRQFTVSNNETFTTKNERERTVPMHEEVFKIPSLRRGNGTEDGLVFCKRGGFRLDRNFV
jgi:site-specific recombinase XerD